MTIIAKYAGTCGRCNRHIVPGQRIEWAKGSKPTHEMCADGRTAEVAKPAGGVKPPATKHGATERQVATLRRLATKLERIDRFDSFSHARGEDEAWVVRIALGKGPTKAEASALIDRAMLLVSDEM